MGCLHGVVAWVLRYLNPVQRTVSSALGVSMLAVFMLLAGVLVLPVERAAAAGDLGPDGYFSTLREGAKPVAEHDWASTRRILFGITDSSKTYGGASVSGGYKTLAKGRLDSVKDTVSTSWIEAATTSVESNEALLWADDTVTGLVAFDKDMPTSGFFDASGYKSNLANLSDQVADKNYSTFEKSLMRSGVLEGLCTGNYSDECENGPKSSEYTYAAFPLSTGDMYGFFPLQYGSPKESDLQCAHNLVGDWNHFGTCENGGYGYWTRSQSWGFDSQADSIYDFGGGPFGTNASLALNGLRPALRLKLDNILLTANSDDQGQSASGDLGSQLWIPAKPSMPDGQPRLSVARVSGNWN
jgi:hypothetical protein